MDQMTLVFLSACASAPQIVLAQCTPFPALPPKFQKCAMDRIFPTHQNLNDQKRDQQAFNSNDQTQLPSLLSAHIYAPRLHWAETQSVIWHLRFVIRV